MRVARTLRHVLAIASLVLVAGCLPNRGGATDPDKALLYLHLMAADLAMSADAGFELGEQDDSLGFDIKEMQAAAKALPANGSRTRKVASLVDDAARTVTEFHKAMPAVADAQAASRSIAERTPQMAAMWDEVLRGMGEGGAPFSQVQIANREVVLADRMSRRAKEIVEGGDVSITAADALARDIAVYAQVLEAMRSGQPDIGLERVTSASAQSALERLQQLQVEHAADAQRLTSRLQAVNDARGAADRLRSLRLKLLEAAPPRYAPPAGR